MIGLVHHIPKEASKVSTILRKHFRIGDNGIQDLLRLGSVLNGTLRLFQDELIPKGTKLTIYLRPNRFAVEKVDWKSIVITEKSDFLVVAKPGGIPVHATPDNAFENILEQMRKQWGKDLYVTQRLDVPVSGLMVIARRQRFQAFFNELLREGRIEKRYIALTTSPPPVGKHTHYMAEKGGRRRHAAAEPGPGRLPCQLEVQEVTALTGTPFYRCVVRPLSGRTHQIRSQLSALRCPVVGDSLYGYRGDRAFTSDRREIALASAYLKFNDPQGKTHEFQLEPAWKLHPPPQT